ncbi:MAG: hypothetical protein JXA49_00680 [Actinobacteria bacterium]|nr:hypothetical protein [Actinomycetota bacterium]
MNGNLENYYYPGHRENDKRKKLVSILAVAAITVIVTLIAVLLIAGVIKIGHPRIKSAVMTNSTNAQTEKPGKEVEKFSGNESRIYCSARVRAFNDTPLRVKWQMGKRLMREQRATFGEVIGSISAKCLTVEGYVNFYLDRPEGGWQYGNYNVTFQLADIETRDINFTIGGTNTQGSVEMSTYEDPEGLFSVSVPDSWYKADPDTLSGGLAGFISDKSIDYPPRFEILATAFENVSIEYLNTVLESQGTPENEFFQSYTLGERNGAMRDFKWTYAEGDASHNLHSIQFVVQGDKAVYGLNFHSASSEYEDNLGIYSAIVSSLNIHDGDAQKE